MERFVRTSVDDLELLLAADECDFEDAVYPPRCDPARGRLRMRQLEVGAVKVEVERRDLSTDDFRLAVLFHGGSCVFAGAEDVAGFFRGPVAAAFGIEAEPLPERPSGDLLDDLRPPSQSPELDAPPPVLADVIRDLADASDIGARSFDYAARDLLTAAFADAAREGVRGRVAIDPGPPLTIVAAREPVR